jgi:FO synthase
VTYVVNRNINFTDICYTGCRLCAVTQMKTDADAYTLSLDEIAARVVEAVAVGGPRCTCRGVEPEMPGTIYADTARAVKSAAPRPALPLADGGHECRWRS